MDIAIVEECARLAAAEKILFPDVVARLSEADVESYMVNMLVLNTIFYGANTAHEMPLDIKAEVKVAEAFDQDGVVQSIRASQAQKIGYQEFMKKIMAAGVLFYLVCIRGRKAIYFGRNGELHVELFPTI